MPGSLIDFGEFARTAEAMHRNEIYEQNSLQQVEQNRLHAIQLKQNAAQAQLGGLLKLADDPTISANPLKKNQVLSAAWKLAGLPDVTPGDFQRGLDMRQEHLQGLLENDPAKAADAFVKIAAAASPTELKQLTDAAKDFHTLRDRVENVNAMQQLNQARFEKLHDSQAKVKVGLFPYAQGVRDFTAALEGTDRKDFTTSMLMFSKLGPERGKTIPTPPQAAETAKNANDVAERYSQLADRAKMQLQLLESGEPLPRGVEKRDLVEQVEVGTRMAQSYDTLGRWALTPFDKTALKAAKDAKVTIEQYRKDLDKLDAANKSESAAVARDSLNFRQSEAGIKHFAEQAVNQGQASFAALPSAQQTPQEAARIAREIEMKIGVLPSTELILEGIKNPNKALVEINQNAPGERKDIAEARSQLDMIGRIDTLYDPSFVGPLDSRLGRIKSFTGTIKEQEAEFRSAVTLMRTELRKFYFGTAQSKQELQGALESIPDLNMSNPQFTASLKQTKQNVQSILQRRGEVMEQSGVRNPQPKSFNTRYEELKKSSQKMTESDIFKQMQTEGY